MEHLIPPVTQSRPSAAELLESVPGWVRDGAAERVRDVASGWGEDHCRAAAWAIWRQGLGPLVWSLLDARGAREALPGPLQAYLEEDFALSRQRNHILLGDLAAILHAAAQIGIEVVPLKGSLLALLCYDDPGLRPMADIDLLVRPQDQLSLMEVVQRHGYVLTRKRSRHTVLSRAGKTASDVVRLGEHPGNPMNVEIHDHIAGDYWGLRYRLTESMWASSSPGRLAEAPARLLSRMALMKHLLIHAATNMMDRTLRAIHLYDLGVLGPNLAQADWEALGDGSSGSVESRLLYAPLALAERCLGAQPAPPQVLARLREATPASLIRFVGEAPLKRMTIAGFTWPRRPHIPWAWYAPGREWLGPVRYMLLPTAAERRLAGSSGRRHRLAVAQSARLLRSATYPARALWRAIRATRPIGSTSAGGEDRD